MPDKATQAWSDKAAEDEQVVAAIRRAGGPWSAAAYHVQQAAEKYIKAALVQSGIAPPRTHDLPDLLDKFTLAPIPFEVGQAADALTIYAWLTRYPGGPPVAEADLNAAEIDLAVLKAWALSIISD